MREGATMVNSVAQGDQTNEPFAVEQSRDLVATRLEPVTSPGNDDQQARNSFPPIQLAEEQDLEDLSHNMRELQELDSDSALGSDSESVTASLTESIYNYRKEYGRTYHAYKDGKYIFPNDEREADRLDLQHHILQLTYGNNLHFAPLNNPKHAIDVGTGTGIWAVDFADEYPDCQVIGIDLSPGQPTLVPPNLKFIIDDAEDIWLYDQPFDYIHVRLMNGCFADWSLFFRGWLEVQDYGLPVTSADGTHEKTDLTQWGELLSEASSALGRPMGSIECSDLHVQRMQDAGFVDIQTRMFMWPTNGWPKDPFMKELGRWNQINILDGLEGFCLALLMRGLGWKKEEVDVLVARVSRDLKDRRIHAYFPMPVVYGRKPYPHEAIV
nr:putative methyltransferase tdie [Quercus suber]